MRGNWDISLQTDRNLQNRNWVTLREVIFARRNFREFAKFSEFSGQFAKISSRQVSQGQSFTKINSRKKNSEIDRFAKIRFYIVILALTKMI